MEKIIIITYLNSDSSQDKKDKFVQAQWKHIQTDMVEKIYVMHKGFIPELQNEKVQYVPSGDRIKFSDVLFFMKSIWKQNTLFAISKPTIYLQSGLGFLPQIYWIDKCLVLSRHVDNYKPFTTWQHKSERTLRWDCWNEHDMWIFGSSPQYNFCSEASWDIETAGASAKFAKLITDNMGAVNYSNDIIIYDDCREGEYAKDEPESKYYPEPYGYILPMPVTQWENIQTF